METGNNTTQAANSQPQPQYAQPQYAQQPYGQPAPPPIFMTEVGKMRLQSAAKWAKNVGVCGVIMLILLLIMFVIIGITASKASHYAGSYGGYYAYQTASTASSAITITMIISYLVVVGLSIYPLSRLFGFKKFVDNAFASNDSNLMAEAYHQMDGYFKFTGIMSIIGLVFMVFYLIIMVFAVNQASRYF